MYGLVAGIVKMDDVGLYLLRKSLTGGYNGFQRVTGRALLVAAPLLMKTLAFVGTIAMFLVGGGILTHNIPFMHHLAESINHSVEQLSFVISLITDGVAGLIAGSVIVGIVSLFSKKKDAH